MGSTSPACFRSCIKSGIGYKRVTYLCAMQFELSLAGTDAVSNRRMTTLHLMLAFVLCGLGAGCFLLYWFTAVSPNFTSPYSPFAIFGVCSMLAGGMIAGISIFYKNWLLQGRRNILLRFLEIGLLSGGGLLFYLSDQHIPATIFIIVAFMISIATFWEAQRPAVQLVRIDKSGVSLPKNNSAKLLRWSEIEGLLLRHSILSIELTGNRLVQRNIVDTDVDPSAIEIYSASLIEENATKRAKEW